MSGGRAIDSAMQIALLPLVEPHTLASDIRRFYQEYSLLGSVTQWNDPRIGTRTYQGAHVSDIVRSACLEMIVFFHMNSHERRDWMRQSRVQIGSTYTEGQVHTFCNTALYAADIPFQYVLMAPFMDNSHMVHRMQLSFGMAYWKTPNELRYVVVHYQHDHLVFIFDLPEFEVEGIIYGTGEDPLLDPDDNPIIFMELTELSVAELWPTT